MIAPDTRRARARARGFPEWHLAGTLAEAAWRAYQGAVVVAGGVDVSERLRLAPRAPATVVCIRGLAELHRVEVRHDGLCIGTLVTLQELAQSPVVLARFPEVARAAGMAATPAVRAAATVGGNLLQYPRCWSLRTEGRPCRRLGADRCPLEGRWAAEGALFDRQACACAHPSSLAPVLIAHDARVEAHSISGMVRLPLDRLYPPRRTAGPRPACTTPADILTCVHLRWPVAGEMAFFDARRVRDTITASVAGRVAVRGQLVTAARVVLGGVAPSPWRATEAEARLLGARLSPAALRDAVRAELDRAVAPAASVSKHRALKAAALTALRAGAAVT
ncbi:FAD binding domain-containing protein [Anaeromyxobacter dehalogenans]|uniref:FAD-binding molybdopterin dehydrogenase n=1 Tax=Anaeromyxobacter dehalogenans (strain 2CP-C) TaxID=290397 RepID=Q2IMT0_ANADE|nr:FAD binding domain-containing protein [Anaeromyxobacter dehalogenans]ABC80115.1 FAD-binding molybdopterin dehydrogenase [Anaeromyxobacter dehalogenans 2CP-C]